MKGAADFIRQVKKHVNGDPVVHMCLGTGDEGMVFTVWDLVGVKKCTAWIEFSEDSLEMHSDPSLCDIQARRLAKNFNDSLYTLKEKHA
jgi:hypothetical protein